MDINSTCWNIYDPRKLKTLSCWFLTDFATLFFQLELIPFIFNSSGFPPQKSVKGNGPFSTYLQGEMNSFLNSKGLHFHQQRVFSVEFHRNRKIKMSEQSSFQRFACKLKCEEEFLLGPLRLRWESRLSVDNFIISNSTARDFCLYGLCLCHFNLTTHVRN